jgi:DNA-binding LytR/AlgR family response regulator
VEPARLAQALERVQARLRATQALPGLAAAAIPAVADAAALQALLARLSAEARRPALPAVIQASVGKEVRLIRIDEVIFFEADARYTRVVWRSPGVAGAAPQDGEALIRTPLKELLVQLDPQQFWQVHRSVIVAQRHVEAAVRIDEHNMQLRLRGRSERLPVSRHFQGLFRGQ